jgi:hypothetical protein
MVNVPLSLGSQTVPSLSYQLLTAAAHNDWNSAVLWLTATQVKIKVMLQPMISWPVCPDVKHSYGAQDQIFITTRQLQVCWCGSPSLMRGRVCCLQLLLDLASAFILWSKSHMTHDHILMSEIQDLHKLEGQVPIFISPRNRVSQLYL